MVLRNQINQSNGNLQPIQRNTSIYDFFEDNDFNEINDLDITPQDETTDIQIWNQIDVVPNTTDTTQINENESEDEKPCGTTGLTNMGNTCYLNSVIQALSNIEIFANLLNCKSKRNEQLVIENFFKKNNPSSLMQIQKYKTEQCFTTTMDKTIEILWSNQYESITPTSIRKAIVYNFQQFNNNHQHDAEECLREILNKLDEELQYNSYDITFSSEKFRNLYNEYNYLDSPNKKVFIDNLNENDRNKLKEILSYINFNKLYSPIQEIFQFVISSNITCNVCMYSSTTKAPELILQCEIPDIPQKTQTFDSTTYNYSYNQNYPYNSYSYGYNQNVYNGLITSEGEDEDIEETEPNESESKSDTDTDADSNLDSDSDSDLNINKCLKKFFSPEKLTNSNKWYCEKCKKYVDATKKMKICRSGNILIIQFKRFKQCNNTFVKNTEEIKFPHELNMKRFFEKEEDCLFKLRSVINHEGHNLQYGHYTTYALNEMDSKWYYYNDENVVEETDLSLIDDDDAYILIYQKK
jgi:ubiquitin C-terminal hydrolase